MSCEKKADQCAGRPGLAVDIAGIKMKNPVMPASGTFGYGEEYAPFLDLEKIGAIVTKGLSLKPKAGNPTPRIAETISGMLNAIGLQNVGIDDFIKFTMPFLREVNTPVIVNFFGNTLEEYGEVAERLADIPEVDGVELNISCPNVKKGGIVFGTEPEAASQVVSLVRKKIDKPLIVKLTPNVTDITVMARAVEEAGADAICCINTLTGMAIDVKTRRPRLANLTGGAHGLPGGADGQGPGCRRRRHRLRRGRIGIPYCRGVGGAGRHGQLRRPGGDGSHRRWHRGVLPRRGHRRHPPTHRQSADRLNRQGAVFGPPLAVCGQSYMSIGQCDGRDHHAR